MQRELSFGGIFLLFLLLFAIINSIHPDTATTEDTVFPIEDTTSFSEDTISLTEDTTTKEVTISIEDIISCTTVIDGDTFRLSTKKYIKIF